MAVVLTSCIYFIHHRVEQYLGLSKVVGLRMEARKG